MLDRNLLPIRHMPTGYYPRDGVIYDRTPRWPAAGEFVLVRAEIREEFTRGRVVVHCTCNGREMEIPGRKVSDHHARRAGLFDLSGEDQGPVEYFLFELGRFAAGDEVEYSIFAGATAPQQSVDRSGSPWTLCTRPDPTRWSTRPRGAWW